MTGGEEPKMSTETTAYEATQVDADELVAEIERYLAAVETFRAEGCEPTWAAVEALSGSWRLEWLGAAPAGPEGVPTPRPCRSREDGAAPQRMLLLAELDDAAAVEDDEELLLGRVA